MATTVQFLTFCPHARPIPWAELTWQVAESSRQLQDSPPDGPPPAAPDQAAGQQVILVLCTHPPGACSCVAPNSTAARLRFRLADPTAPPRPPRAAKSGRVKPATTQPGRRRVGKPRRQSTIWLQGEIAKLADMYDYEHLYQEWLRRYTAEVGQAPVDTRTSFRNTAAGCIRRILGR